MSDSGKVTSIEGQRHVRQPIAERVKSRYPHELKALDDSCRQLEHEIAVLRDEIAEAQSQRGGTITAGNENRISAAYRSVIKKVGALQVLQTSGVFNPIGR